MAEVLIEFVADYSQLDGAIDALEQLGQIDKQTAASFKQTNAAMRERANAIKQAEAAVKGEIKSLDQLDAKSRKFIEEFITGFSEGIVQELKDAQKEIDLLNKKLADKKGSDGVKSLKQELAGLKTQIAQAKATGGPIDPAWIKRAGELKDAMADAGAAINEAGSDTRGIDNALGAVTALAGGFAALQGATALFGNESKELEKTMLKVNASLAALQGLQAVVNSLQAEGAITLGLLQLQEKLHNVQLAITGALESKNIVIRYAAAAAQRVLNAVMAANPIGLLITALVGVASALVVYTRNSRAAAEATGELNGAYKNLTDELDKSNEAIANNTRRNIIDLKKSGAIESELIKAKLSGLQAQLEAGEQAYRRNKLLADKNRNDSEESKKLDEKLTASRKQNSDLRLQIQETEIELNDQLANERAAQLAKQKDAENKALENSKLRLMDEILLLKAQQIQLDKTSETYAKLALQIGVLETAYENLGARQAQITLNWVENKIAAQGAIDSLKQNVTGGFQQALGQVSGQVEKVKTDVVDLGGVLSGAFTPDPAAKKGLQDFLDENRQAIQNFMTATSALSSGIQALQSEQANATSTLIANKKKEVDELLKAGAITEKEALARQKRIEAAEKRAQYQAAVKQKQAAIFSALISGAQAVVNALATPPAPFGIALAAIVGGLALAQVRAISRRPLPKFATGKKGSWSGVGVMGEAGTEMKVSKDGKLEVANKPTVTYIGPTDKIYTAGETKKIMQNLNYHITKPGHVEKQAPGLQIDYDKLAHAVSTSKKGSASTIINIDKDFVAESVAGSLSRMMYMQRRYMLKK